MGAHTLTLFLIERGVIKKQTVIDVDRLRQNSGVNPSVDGAR
jgi:hypothetical protein